MTISDLETIHFDTWPLEGEMIPDDWLEDVFDTREYDTSNQHLEHEDHETDWESIISPEYHRIMLEYAERINHDTEGMSSDEAEAYMEFAWGALIGPLVSALAPVAVKAIGGLINRSRRRPSRRPQRRPAPQRPTPQRPTPPRAQAPSPSRPSRNTSRSSAGQTALQALTSILTNPGLIQALTRLASSGESRITTIGENAVPIREGAILNAIAEFAKEAKMKFAEEYFEDGESYLYEGNNESMVDPSSPELRAQRFIDLVNEN